MLKNDIITKNANINIKNSQEYPQKIIVECEDETEYYCPVCGSYHLRCKDTLLRNVKGISIGGKPTILQFKTHKYKCEDCGHYFNANPTGLLKYQHATEFCKKEVFHRH
ncbi:MAG: transposase family protein, partial [Alphaproteobacteria bacterium]|nr:transposase family protein [Alphaproteobacteria bacterium]